jgi:hypothetical protein
VVSVQTHLQWIIHLHEASQTTQGCGPRAAYWPPETSRAKIHTLAQ